MTPLNSFDSAVMGFVQTSLHNPVTDAFFSFITNLGELGAIWIAAAVVLLFFKKYRKYGILALVSLLFTALIGEVFLKNLLARPRPFVDFPDFALLIPPPHGFSFPSGHSASSFTAATVFLFANKKLGLCSLILAALIAFSRVFLFVHYPSDVLAGMVLGIAVGVLVVLGYRALEKRRLPPAE